MLTLPITNAAGEVGSWVVSCSWSGRRFIVVRQVNGDLLVMDGGVRRVVVADDATVFLNRCQNSETINDVFTEGATCLQLSNDLNRRQFYFQ